MLGIVVAVMLLQTGMSMNKETTLEEKNTVGGSTITDNENSDTGYEIKAASYKTFRSIIDRFWTGVHELETKLNDPKQVKTVNYGAFVSTYLNEFITAVTPFLTYPTLIPMNACGMYTVARNNFGTVFSYKLSYWHLLLQTCSHLLDDISAVLELIKGKNYLGGTVAVVTSTNNNLTMRKTQAWSHAESLKKTIKGYEARVSRGIWLPKGWCSNRAIAAAAIVLSHVEDLNVELHQPLRNCVDFDDIEKIDLKCLDRIGEFACYSTKVLFYDYLSSTGIEREEQSIRTVVSDLLGDVIALTEAIVLLWDMSLEQLGISYTMDSKKEMLECLWENRIRGKSVSSACDTRILEMDNDSNISDKYTVIHDMCITVVETLGLAKNDPKTRDLKRLGTRALMTGRKRCGKEASNDQNQEG